MKSALASLLDPTPEQTEFQLLNRFQRDFPLRARPFAMLAAQLDMGERGVIDALKTLQAQGVVSRVGAVFQPNVVGASALAALAVPLARIDEVAAYVNAWPEVNHNYEREHHFNLWFVVTAADPARLHAILQEIESVCSCGPVLVLPMLQDFHIDLGFDLAAGDSGRFRGAGPLPAQRAASAMLNLSGAERALIRALQEGLPLVERPYAALGCSESEAIATIARWLDDGVIKRFGIIVRHRELGFTDNAMLVLDVPDAEVDLVGRRIAASGQVTLCYRRQRHVPDWPYNLFCMMHGKQRDETETRILTLAETCGLDGYPRAALFSRRRFKQCGARYLNLDSSVDRLLLPGKPHEH